MIGLMKLYFVVNCVYIWLSDGNIFQLYRIKSCLESLVMMKNINIETIVVIVSENSCYQMMT